MSQQKITNLGALFDASKIEPQQPMEAIPPGWYNAAVTDGEIQLTEGGSGRRLSLEWTVQDGPFKSRKIFDGFNYIHSNSEARRISGAQLSAICHATSVFQLQDVSQLFNKPHQIKVGIEPQRVVDLDGNDSTLPAGSPNTKTYEARNRFQGAKAGTVPVSAAAVSGNAGPAPAWAITNAPTAANQGIPPAAVVPPVANVATTPTPAATTPGEAAKGKPGRKPKAATAAVERKFFVDVQGQDAALPESKIREMLAAGMPATTGVCLEGEDAFKTAADYGIAISPPVAVVATPVAAAKPVPASVPPVSGGLPPWAVTS